jgi:hypothetical protein
MNIESMENEEEIWRLKARKEEERFWNTGEVGIGKIEP